MSARLMEIMTEEDLRFILGGLSQLQRGPAINPVLTVEEVDYLKGNGYQNLYLMQGARAVFLADEGGRR